MPWRFGALLSRFLNSRPTIDPVAGTVSRRTLSCIDQLGERRDAEDLNRGEHEGLELQ